MLVSDIMSTELVTCGTDASLQSAAESMLRARVGSAIVVEDGAPVGIVTETDVVHAGYATDRPFSDIPVRRVMNSPVITIQPSRTVRAATEQMGREGVKKLVVVEDLALVGVVTAQDLVRHFGDLRSEIHHLEALRFDPESRLRE